MFWTLVNNDLLSPYVTLSLHFDTVGTHSQSLSWSSGTNPRVLPVALSLNAKARILYQAWHHYHLCNAERGHVALVFLPTCSFPVRISDLHSNFLINT